MGRKPFLLSVALFVAVSGAYAQSPAPSGVGVETDPFTTLVGAQTLSVVIEPAGQPHKSLFLNIVRADFPQWVEDLVNPENKGKGFDARIPIGGGLGIDYFRQPERTGAHLRAHDLIETDGTVLTQNLIPRVGYRWYPSSHLRLYLNPFIGIRYEHAFGKILIIEGQRYRPAGVQPFGTVHVGYHF